MTTITRATLVSPDTNTLVKSTQIAGDLLAGETILACAACYISASDGKVYMGGSASTDVPTIHGYTARGAVAGQPVTLYSAIRAQYASPTTPMTPGAPVYMTGEGVLGDAAPAAGVTTAIGISVTAEDVFLNALVFNDQTPVP